MAVTISLMRLMSMAATLARRARGRPRCGQVVTETSARRDEEGLGCVADRPVGVVQSRAGDARAVFAQRRARRQCDPLAARLAGDLDRQVEVDEEEPLEIEHVRDAV